MPRSVLGSNIILIIIIYVYVCVGGCCRRSPFSLSGPLHHITVNKYAELHLCLFFIPIYRTSLFCARIHILRDHRSCGICILAQNK